MAPPSRYLLKSNLHWAAERTKQSCILDNNIFTRQEVTYFSGTSVQMRAWSAFYMFGSTLRHLLAIGLPSCSGF